MRYVSQAALFMITLILITSCKEDTPSLFTDKNTQSNFEVYMNDYEASPYKWGYINPDGDLVIKNQYDDCRDFQEGKAAVLNKGLWGFIDKNGNEIIKPMYRQAYEWSEGLGLVQTFSGAYIFVDDNGRAAFDTLNYTEVLPFKNGRAKVRDGEFTGYIDKKGNLVIAAQYSRGTHFKNGYALVTFAGKQTIIGTLGTNVLNDNYYDKVYAPSSNMVRIKQHGKYTYFNLKTKSIANKQYEKATDYQANNAVVFDGKSYFLIDKNSKTEKLPYTKVDYGGEGKWIYTNGNKYGYLKNNGEILSLPNYDVATRYKDNMAAIAINNGWGYVDRKGLLAIPPTYPLAWDFKQDRARMINQNGFGFIDKKGEFIIRPYYIEVRDFYEDLARVQIYRK